MRFGIKIQVNLIFLRSPFTIFVITKVIVMARSVALLILYVVVFIRNITTKNVYTQLRLLFIPIILLLSHLPLAGQSLFATGAYIDTHSPIDFVLGESITEYTQPAAIGFLPAMYYSYVSSEKQLTDTAAIQVHFDNTLQQATIYMAYELTEHRPQYNICGIDGNVYISGIIDTMPHFVSYSQLPSGIYLLHIVGIPGRIPFITRWLKN